MKRLWLIGLLALGGCVHASVMQLDATTVEITVSGAPVCGDTGTQQAAYQDAAIATLRAGFDMFIVVGEGGADQTAFVGTTPVYADTYGSSFGNSYSSSTTITGGTPIFLTRHKQKIVIKMFRASDPMAAQAISARSVLGPNWVDKVANGPSSTC